MAEVYKSRSSKLLVNKSDVEVVCNKLNIPFTEDWYKGFENWIKSEYYDTELVFVGDGSFGCSLNLLLEEYPLSSFDLDDPNEDLTVYNYVLVVNELEKLGKAKTLIIYL